jgi:hypothetical protein
MMDFRRVGHGFSAGANPVGAACSRDNNTHRGCKPFPQKRNVRSSTSLAAFFVVALLAALAVVVPVVSCAAMEPASRNGEDSDLQLIPGEVMAPTSPQTNAQWVPKAEVQPAGQPAPEAYRVKIFLDDAFQVNIKRGSLIVPLPAPLVKDWGNRFSLDMRAEVALAPSLALTVADRVNVLLNEALDLSEDGVLNDLKEAYLTWNLWGTTFFDLGRVNVKNGVAVGFNPTDYFKKNAVTTRISEDPSVLRENRLGTLVARGQRIWEKGALTLLVAPEVTHEPDHWWTDDAGGLGLERTNDRTQLLVKGSVKSLWDLNPELLYYNDDGQSNFGLNLSRGIGNQIVAYAEWSIGQSGDLIAEADQAGRDAGIIPRRAPLVLAGSSEDRFRNQLTLGFSYTEKINRTTYFEYHYNEAGFSADDWSQWFHAGVLARRLQEVSATEKNGRGMLAQLWWIRQYAQIVQEPLNRHSFMVKTQWKEAFVKKLDLSGLFVINPNDASFFLQPLAEYHLHPNLTLSLTLNCFLGSDQSEFGSLEQMGNVRVGATYYF